uniref:Uncharacterized protein n=1 Tax=Anopheles atroparvus TaxID=41427 RepID=A0A182JFN5_ANOAO
MEIFDQQTHALLANVSSKVPIFTVNGLDAGLLLKIVIYATNMRGRSEPILLQAYTLKAAEKQTVEDYAVSGSVARWRWEAAEIKNVKKSSHYVLPRLQRQQLALTACRHAPTNCILKLHSELHGADEQPASLTARQTSFTWFQEN